MEEFKKDLQSLAKSLKALTQKTERIAKKLDKRKESRVAKKSKVKVKAKAVKKTVAKKETKITANDIVLDIIKRNRKGLDMATLKKKTGFEGRRTYDTVHRLKKQGKIKKDSKGFYVAA